MFKNNKIKHEGEKAEKPKKKRKWLKWVAAAILFIILYLVSALGYLRIFIPHYFSLTGFPFAQKNYLVVFQNNHELRPGGGFISAFGIAKFQSGFFTGIDIEDVYGDIDEHPYMAPPYPMEKMLADKNYKGYTFRDGNFSPEQNKNAEELIRLLHITKPKLQIDGVISVNYSFLEDLLGTLNGISIDGKFYNKESLFELLEYTVNNVDKHNIEALAGRKNILKSLSQAIIKKIIFNPLRLRSITDTIVRNLAEKQIQLNFKDSSLQNMVSEQAWAGSWPIDYPGDFLALNEANLGGMKSDRYLQRNVTYHVTVEENGPNDFTSTAEVWVDLYHYGIENIPLSGNYSGYFRIFAPKGAQLLAAASAYRNDLKEEDQENTHSFGNIVRLKPGERTQLYYKYRLPSTIFTKENYHLFIPKQSGTEADNYNVIIQLPQGYSVQSNEFEPKENVAYFQDNLLTDRFLNFKILPDKLGPRVVYQTFEGLNTILLVFQEELNGQNLQAENFVIKDDNAKNTGVTDQVSVAGVKKEGKAIRLSLNGVSNQPEEHYVITFRDVSDKHENTIEPNPQTITVVQR